MDIKKTIKVDGKWKDLHFEKDVLVDGYNEEVDLNDLLHKIYRDEFFNLTTTTKVEEIIELEDLEGEE